MSRIFLSYRRADTLAITDKIYASLADNFGKKNVFRDLNSIVGGANFKSDLITRLQECKIMLVIIGEGWLDARDDEGRRRLDDPEDFVRTEVDVALTSDNIHVIPVLINNTAMPTEKALPRNLANLVNYQALKLRGNRHFNSDMDVLIRQLEAYFFPNVSDSIERQLGSFVARVNQSIDQQTGYLDKRLDSYLSKLDTGIHLVAKQRHGYDGYYHWIVNDAKNMKLFLAGRSVLHRIEDDLRKGSALKIEDVIAKKLEGGADIQVMFLDPRSPLIEQLAGDEQQSSVEMLTDIATSIGICRRIYLAIDQKRIDLHASLDICLYDEIPYFSYHKENQQVTIGFYFRGTRGHESAAFEVLDEATQRLFEHHFNGIYAKFSYNHWLIHVNPGNGRIVFNDDCYAKLVEFFYEHISKSDCQRLLPA